MDIHLQVAAAAMFGKPQNYIVLFTRNRRFVAKRLIPNCMSVVDAINISAECDALTDAADTRWAMLESDYAEESEKILMKERGE